MRWICTAVLVFAVGCGGDDAAAPTTTTRGTTTTEDDCPAGFRIGEPHHTPVECLEGLLRSAASAHDVVLTDDAVAQAQSLCRAVTATGATAGVLAKLGDWETGAAPKPADDIPTFVPLAVAVYCPDVYPDLSP